MNQALNKTVSDITDASNITDTGTDIKVYLLPSLPLTRKNRAPAISGLGILYSEELDQILQVFETSNLKDAVSKFSREQAAALNIDPNCRLHWMEIANAAQRSIARHQLFDRAQEQQA